MKTILIVDDTPLGLAALRQALARPGITVLEANSGRMALEVHRRERVDLIVIDLSMPGLDGLEVTRRIRADATLRAVSILMFSDNARDTTRRRCLDAGANAFLSTPFENAELLARVLQLLDVATRKNTQLLAQVEVRGGGTSIAPFIGRILNLSVSGLLLEAEPRLEVGHELAITFFVPGGQTQAKADGRVVRRVTGHESRWGLRFTTLDPLGRQALKEYIDRQDKHYKRGE